MMNKHFILTVWVRLITLKHNIKKKSQYYLVLKHFWFPLIFLMWFDPIGLWKYTRACCQNRLFRTTKENQRKQKYFNFRHYLNLLRCSLVMTSEEYDPIGLWKYTRACRQNRLWDTPQKKLKNKLNRTDNSRCKYLAFKFIKIIT